jgi:hypothetical protein
MGLKLLRIRQAISPLVFWVSDLDRDFELLLMVLLGISQSATDSTLAKEQGRNFEQ